LLKIELQQEFLSSQKWQFAKRVEVFPVVGNKKNVLSALGIYRKGNET